jgi:8-oxo-dGTP pyrophosphatase MutT (NUDIX family)
MRDAVVIIIKNDKNQYLLLNRNYRPFGFGLVGGKVETEDSDIIQACIREIKEEIGVIVERKDIKFKKFFKTIDNDIFVCYLDYNLNEIKELSEEHSEYIFTSDLENINFAGKTREFLT